MIKSLEYGYPMDEFVQVTVEIIFLLLMFKLRNSSKHTGIICLNQN